MQRRGVTRQRFVVGRRSGTRRRPIRARRAGARGGTSGATSYHSSSPTNRLTQDPIPEAGTYRPTAGVQERVREGSARLHDLVADVVDRGWTARRTGSTRRAPATSSGADRLAECAGRATVGRQSRGYDAGKEVNGRKRSIVTDTLGLLPTVVVLTAGVQDRGGAEPVLLDTRLPPPGCGSCSPTVASPAGCSHSSVPLTGQSSWECVCDVVGSPRCCQGCRQTTVPVVPPARPGAVVRG